MGYASNEGEFSPGNLIFFKRTTVHALHRILEEPVVFLAVDTPRRDPKDIIFVNPEDAGKLYPTKRIIRFVRLVSFVWRLSSRCRRSQTGHSLQVFRIPITLHRDFRGRAVDFAQVV